MRVEVQRSTLFTTVMVRIFGSCYAGYDVKQYQCRLYTLMLFAGALRISRLTSEVTLLQSFLGHYEQKFASGIARAAWRH